jgi:hypothetical protein
VFLDRNVAAIIGHRRKTKIHCAIAQLRCRTSRRYSRV